MSKVKKFTTSQYAILRTPEKKELNAFRLYLRQKRYPYSNHGGQIIAMRQIHYTIKEPGFARVTSPLTIGFATVDLHYSTFDELIRKAENMNAGLYKAKSALPSAYKPELDRLRALRGF